MQYIQINHMQLQPNERGRGTPEGQFFPVRTREEERIYRREYRARRRAETESNTTVVPMRTRPGKVEAGVALELAGLAAAAECPGLAAISRRLAAILDDQAAVVHHASAARVLGDVLGRLHDASRGHGGGKLLAMRQARRDE
jgi:hypothetical protein